MAGCIDFLPASCGSRFGDCLLPFSFRSSLLAEEKSLKTGQRVSLARRFIAANSKRTKCCGSACDELVAEAQAATESSGVACRFKKNVAFWVGYVGTDYKGLQIQRGVEGIQSVEDELEEAIYKSGGISESNYKHLDKVRWKRSSRTDKGVHSLCTVITMKLEISSDAWVNDLDGIAIADAFNSHLPSNICIFGVAPVTKSFNARTSCYSRTYDYIFPAGCIGIGADCKPEEVEQKLESFGSILKLLEGRHAFHNYTIRRLYRTSQRRGTYKPNSSRDRNEHKLDDSVHREETEAESDDEEVADDLQNSSLHKQASLLRAYWVDEAEETTDKVRGSHYRKITECSCQGIEVLGDSMAVRIRVTGESFMLHQIRKMVGTAIAVARQVLSEDAISISTCPQARIVLPLAPSQGLILSANSFFPFRGGYVRRKGGNGHFFSKIGIQVSERVASRMNSFWSRNLAPVMAASMDDQESPWKDWLESLECNRIEDSELGSVRDAWKLWKNKAPEKIRHGKISSTKLCRSDITTIATDANA